MEVMAGFRRPPGGRLGVGSGAGHKTRPHADLEISMLASNQQALFRHLRDWDCGWRRLDGVAAVGREPDPAALPSGLGLPRA